MKKKKKRSIGKTIKLLCDPKFTGLNPDLQNDFIEMMKNWAREAIEEKKKKTVH